MSDLCEYLSASLAAAAEETRMPMVAGVSISPVWMASYPEPVEGRQR
jgi:hypothetical protein